MADAPRRWFQLRLRTLLGLILLVTVALSVYSYWSDYSERATRRQRELLSPDAGDVCTVILNRQALGLDRMSPTPGNINGVDNYVRGRFVLMNNEWIVLGGMNPSDPQQWIPRENVLLFTIEAQ